jgi:hypothetical protein
MYANFFFCSSMTKADQERSARTRFCPDPLG